jgi:arsenate reductase (thioredoxin)
MTVNVYVPRMPEFLFVCVHNAGRSQMAAALLDHLSDGSVTVRSAGSEPADPDLEGVRRIRDEFAERVRRLVAQLTL